MKKIVSFTLIMLLLLSIIQTAYGIEVSYKKDIEDHWGQEVLVRWIDKDIIKGFPDGTIKPDEIISKAEFITFINRIYGYYIEAKSNYIDISENDWFASEASKAKENGYMDWHIDSKLNPRAKITRQEVCAIVSHIMQLESPKDSTNLEYFTDYDRIPQWSKEYVTEALANGYINGYPDKTLRVENSISRAEAVTILDRIVGELINTTGTFGPKEGNRKVKGNITINTRDAVIMNTDIEGDLILAAGIRDGDIDLINVKVLGRTIINGGGENSITISGSHLGEVIVYRKGGKIRIVSKESIVKSLIQQTPGKLEGNFEDTIVTLLGADEILDSDSQIEFDGKFGEIIVESPVEIKISGGENVGKITIEEGATGTKIDINKDSKVREIEFNAGADVRGKGVIRKAIVNSNNVEIEQEVKEKKVASGIDGREVKEKSKRKTKSNSDSDSNSNSDITAPSGYSISINQNYINSNNQNSLSFTFSGAEIGTTYNYSIDDTNGSTLAVTGSGTITGANQQISGINVSSLDDDNLTLSVYLIDDAGNRGSNVTDIINKDTVAPSGYSVSIDQARIDQANVTELSFTFSGAEPGTAYNYTIASDGGGTDVTGSGTISAEADCISEIDVSGLSDGTLTLAVYLTDIAGNKGNNEIVTVSKDTNLPGVYDVNIEQSYINIINENNMSFKFSGAEINTTYNYSIDDKNGSTPAVTGSGAVTAQDQIISGINVSSLDDGTLTLTVYLKDDGGNQGLDVIKTIEKDTITPSGYSVDIDQNYINTSNENNMSFTFDGAEIDAMYNYSIDDENGGTPPVTGSGTITAEDKTMTDINVSSLDDDSLTLTVYLTDEAGNQGSDAIKIVEKDTEVPSGYSVSIDQTQINQSNMTGLSFTFSGAEPGTTYNYTITSDGGGTDVTGSETISTEADCISGIDVSGLSDGTLTLAVYLTDTAGNQGNNETDTVYKSNPYPNVKVSGYDFLDDIDGNGIYVFNGIGDDNRYVYTKDEGGLSYRIIWSYWEFGGENGWWWELQKLVEGDYVLMYANENNNPSDIRKPPVTGWINGSSEVIDDDMTVVEQ